MRRLLLVSALVALAAAPAAAMQRAYGWCALGGQQVVTHNSLSTNLFQQNFASCVVVVYIAGTITPAAIFSDNLGTVKANPFIADPTGYWFFYAANGRYDVSFGSGATVQPDILLQDCLIPGCSGGGGGGGAGSVTSVALTAPAWLSVTGSPIVTAGTLAITPATGQTSHQVIGTGVGSTFIPVTLGIADLPFSYSNFSNTKLATTTGALVNGHCVSINAVGDLVDSGVAGCAGAGGGTVTSVTFTGDGTVLSSTPSSAVTTTGTLIAALATAGAHKVLGNNTGSTAAPSYISLSTGELPFTYTGSTTKLATSTGTLTNGHCVSVDASGNLVDNGSACQTSASGTVTSVGLAVPSYFTATGTPVTTAGTLTFAAATGQTSHTVLGTFAGTSLSLGALGTGDLPFTYSGNTTKLATTTGTLTNGHCVSIDANGNIVDNGGTCGTGAGGGTVTSVAMTVPTGFQLSGTPITTAGTLALSMPSSWATGDLLLGNGANSVARLGIGANGQVLTSNGTTAVWGSSGGSGTVTSVGLSFPGFTVTNSPVTGAGTLTITNPLTTTGDVPYFSGGSWTRLPVGTNGQCMKTDGTNPLWGPCGTGTVTSVGLIAPTGFTITGSPVTAAGSLTFSMPGSWTTGDLLLGNGANSVTRLGIGSSGQALVSNGTTAAWGNVGAVTSVSLTAPAQFTVSGSPVTSSGTLALGWNTIAAHTFLGNNTGSTAVPAAATIGTGDLPFTYSNPSNTKLATTTGSLANGHCVSIDANGNLVDSGTSGCSGSGLGAIPADNVVGNFTASTAIPTSQTVPSCANDGNHALVYVAHTLTCASIPTLVNPMTTIGDMIVEGGGPAPAALKGATAPASVPQVLVSTPTSGGVAQIPAWSPAGLPVNTQSGTTYTVLATDRAGVVLLTNNTTSTAVTLPQAASTGFTNSFAFVICNAGTVIATITPTTSTINGAASLQMRPLVAGGRAQCATIFADASNNYQVRVGLPTDSTGRLQIGSESTNTMTNSGTSTTVTQVAHATGTAGVYAPSAIVTADLPVAHTTRTVVFNDPTPVTGDDGIYTILDSATSVHLTRFSCGVTGTTSVVTNLVSGGNSLIADMTATAGTVNQVIVTTWANGASQCGGTSSCAVGAHIPVTLHIGTVNGAPTNLACALDYTVD